MAGLDRGTPGFSCRRVHVVSSGLQHHRVPYNVIGGLATNEQERIYNSVALRIASKELVSATDAVRSLAPIYVADNPFRQAFAEKVLRTTSSRNRHVVRYILFCLERQLTGQEYDIDSPQYTLEHVLPESPEGNWPGFTDEQAAEFVYRLGNGMRADQPPRRDGTSQSSPPCRTASRRASIESW